MKKLIATCIIFGCLLMPLKGYSENSEEYNESPVMTFMGNVVAAGIAGVIGVMIIAVVYYIKAGYNEAGWVNKAREFHSTNAQQDPGQAFAKYQEYLSKLATFLTEYPYRDSFHNDFKSVLEMSQDDSRLTLSEKQEIVDKFAAKLDFPTEAQKQKVKDDWREYVKKQEEEREEKRKWGRY